MNCLCGIDQADCEYHRAAPDTVVSGPEMYINEDQRWGGSTFSCEPWPGVTQLEPGTDLYWLLECRVSARTWLEKARAVGRIRLGTRNDPGAVRYYCRCAALVEAEIMRLDPAWHPMSADVLAANI